MHLLAQNNWQYRIKLIMFIAEFSYNFDIPTYSVKTDINQNWVGNSCIP